MINDNDIDKQNLFFFKVREQIVNYNVTSVYFRYNSKLYKCNKDNLKFLKDMLILPYKVETYALSRANVGSIIRYLRDDNTKFMYSEITRSNDKYLRFEILFYDKEKEIIKTREYI